MVVRLAVGPTGVVIISENRWIIIVVVFVVVWFYMVQLVSYFLCIHCMIITIVYQFLALSFLVALLNSMLYGLSMHATTAMFVVSFSVVCMHTQASIVIFFTRAHV